MFLHTAPLKVGGITLIKPLLLNLKKYIKIKTFNFASSMKNSSPCFALPSPLAKLLSLSTP